MAKYPEPYDASDLNFTQTAEDMLRKLLPDLDFDKLPADKRKELLSIDNAEKIYSYLVNDLQHLGFSDQLKRHIYRETQMEDDFYSIPNEVFQRIIIESFRDNATDYSFYPTKAHKKDVTRSWLERKIVSRDTVLLLGFGLKMDVKDVNKLLHKGLHEPFLDPKEPLEAICQYCFRKGYSFQRFKRIWEQFDPEQPAVVVSGNNMDSTAQCQKKLESIDNDDDLMIYLYHLPLFRNSKRQSLSARKHFERLYDSIRVELAKRKNEDLYVENAIHAQRKAEKLARSDKRNWEENHTIVDNLFNDAHVYTKDEIGDSDIENELYASVTKNAQGNLPPMKQSSLNELFDGKRLNRQHIGRILSGEDPITRYDLITMSFFNHDLQLGDNANEISEHYESFVRATNIILKECNMDNLYAANPYELFILLCMRTESPIEAYSEIWGMSYDDQ